MDKNLKKSLIVALARELDITPQMYQRAIKVVNGLSNYIQNSQKESKIYKQGSFRLGTTIKPCKKDKFGDYDIDLVVQYDIGKGRVLPEDIKKRLGDLLKESNYKNSLDGEGKKCWTLNYSYKDETTTDFHIDLLPCVPEAEKEKLNISPETYRSSAIAITKIKDKNAKPYEYSWDCSNPAGYAMWFDAVNNSRYAELKNNDKKRIYSANSKLFESVDKIDDAYTRSPLQMVIQILKRHRDVMYLHSDMADYKPISIIITTLVGKIVEENEVVQNNTYDLLETVLKGLNFYSSLTGLGKTSDFGEDFKTKKLITKHIVDGKVYWCIKNPANSKENLANKWNESSQYATEFFRWVKKATNDLIDILDRPIDEIKEKFKQCLGEDIMEIFEKNNFGNLPKPKPLVVEKAPQPYNRNGF